MRIRAALGWAIAIAAVLLPAHTSPAVAADPTVVGKVTGKLPRPARAATEVRAFEAGAARLVAAATVSRTGAFKLALPPGGYVLAAGIIPARGRSSAVRRRVVPLTLAAGQRRTGVRIAKPTARVSTRARSAYSQESGAITPGTIAFTVEPFTGATGNFAVLNRGLSDMLQTDLASTPCRSALLANSRDRALIENELGFQQSRYVDPATQVTRNFATPDIVVRGRLQTRGNTVAYTLTLVDARTGSTLETITGTLSGDFFAGEARLARRLAARVCAYGEVFEITLIGTGTGNFATHFATGTLAADPITARPTAKDAGGATNWEAGAPASWTNVVITSKTECTYVNPVSSGSGWAVKLARVGDALDVEWISDARGTATVVCEGQSVEGQPTTALIGSTPTKFLLPSNGRQAITGGLMDQGDGWNNTLELRVRTIRVELL